MAKAQNKGSKTINNDGVAGFMPGGDRRSKRRRQHNYSSSIKPKKGNFEFCQILQGVLTGALFSGIMLAICFGLITNNSTTTGELGLKERDFWWLASLFGFLVGFIFGGLISGIIVKLQLSLIKSFLLSFICSLCLVFIITIWLGGGWSDSITYNLISIIIIESINGLLVSFLFNNSAIRE